jgi:hypothetical protein
MTNALAAPTDGGPVRSRLDLLQASRDAASAVVDGDVRPVGPGAHASGTPSTVPSPDAPLTSTAVYPTDANTAASPPRGAPATTPTMYALTQVPAPGTVLKINESGLGEVINQFFRKPMGQMTDPTGSNWTNQNDVRLVVPIMKAQSGAISTSIDTLPGREMSWATLNIGESNADSKLNFDGIHGAVRLGIAGPLMSPIAVAVNSGQSGFNAVNLQWAEFRVGAEGLVFTGRVADGKFDLTGFDIENGFFKTQLDGVAGWAGHHLASAIPVGVVGVGAAALAVSEIAHKTGKDIPLPIGVTVYNDHNISIRPIVRPIFGKDDFIKFGGAEVSLGYTLPGKVSVSVVPGYNNDPTRGPSGFTVAGRVNVPLPFNGTVGAEVRYNPEGGASAFVGAGFTF